MNVESIIITKYTEDGDTESETINDYTDYNGMHSNMTSRRTSRQSMDMISEGYGRRCSIDSMHETILPTRFKDSHINDEYNDDNIINEEDEICELPDQNNENGMIEIIKRKKIKKIISRTTSINGVPQDTEVEEYILQDTHNHEIQSLSKPRDSSKLEVSEKHDNEIIKEDNNLTNRTDAGCDVSFKDKSKEYQPTLTNNKKKNLSIIEQVDIASDECCSNGNGENFREIPINDIDVFENSSVKIKQKPYPNYDSQESVAKLHDSGIFLNDSIDGNPQYLSKEEPTEMKRTTFQTNLKDQTALNGNSTDNPELDDVVEIIQPTYVEKKYELDRPKTTESSHYYDENSDKEFNNEKKYHENIPNQKNIDFVTSKSSFKEPFNYYNGQFNNSNRSKTHDEENNPTENRDQDVMRHFYPKSQSNYSRYEQPNECSKVKEDQNQDQNQDKVKLKSNYPGSSNYQNGKFDYSNDKDIHCKEDSKENDNFHKSRRDRPCSQNRVDYSPNRKYQAEQSPNYQDKQTQSEDDKLSVDTKSNSQMKWMDPMKSRHLKYDDKMNVSDLYDSIKEKRRLLSSNNLNKDNQRSRPKFRPIDSKTMESRIQRINSNGFNSNSIDLFTRRNKSQNNSGNIRNSFSNNDLKFHPIPRAASPTKNGAKNNTPKSIHLYQRRSNNSIPNFQKLLIQAHGRQNSLGIMSRSQDGDLSMQMRNILKRFDQIEKELIIFNRSRPSSPTRSQSQKVVHDLIHICHDCCYQNCQFHHIHHYNNPHCYCDNVCLFNNEICCTPDDCVYCNTNINGYTNTTTNNKPKYVTNYSNKYKPPLPTRINTQISGSKIPSTIEKNNDNKTRNDKLKNPLMYSIENRRPLSPPPRIRHLSKDNNKNTQPEFRRQRSQSMRR